ncbi:MAG: hypothetical protein Q7S13_03570 [Candidatus Omnitrophota bacterium]|nr:hypothetical protein [Candidatus Omnitrophota bacterium]
MIQLKSGQVINGTIIERTDQHIRVDVGVAVPVTYFAEDISTIDGVSFSSSPSAIPKKAVPPPTTKARSDHASSVQHTKIQPIEKNMARPLPPVYQRLKEIKEEEERKEAWARAPWDQKLLRYLQSIPLPLLLFLSLVFYLICCWPVMLIGDKLGIDNPWMAWVPILHQILVVRMGEKPLWWAILLFVPFLSLIAKAIVWMRITDLLQRPFWLGIAAAVPGFNLMVPWYLALMRTR